MTRPALTPLEADAIAERVQRALAALAVTVTGLHLEPVPAGLLIVARIADRPGACLVPHGYRVSYEDVARTLVGDAQGHVLPVDAQ